MMVVRGENASGSAQRFWQAAKRTVSACAGRRAQRNALRVRSPCAAGQQKLGARAQEDAFQPPASTRPVRPIPFRSRPPDRWQKSQRTNEYVSGTALGRETLFAET